MGKEKQIAFLFPGQGAQVVGMGKSFYDQFSVARETFQEADEILNRPLSKYIFEGPESDLMQTKNAQVALFVVSCAIWRTLKSQFPNLHPSVCAGLSLGEYTALVAAGKMTFAEALPLVQARGQLMQQDCERQPGGMSVVLGLDEAAVRAGLEGISGVWVANLNCPGQVVISGEKGALEKAVEPLKAKGAKRVLPLDVSGAFHSGMMRGAQEGLKSYIETATFADSETQIVMNVPGNLVADLATMRSHLVAQVTQPVRWQEGVAAMQNMGVDLFIEMGPGKTLAGMNKRIGVTAPTISIETVADLEQITTHEALCC
jgi:[acyl-carrier-protein] S-malonyltransferase